ncbi:DNA methyltransferase [Deltaproteobacteria bacterium Smac51]|nr:DNA methyltransferase [Deltaproteobacteria bacterium Smac51]
MKCNRNGNSVLPDTGLSRDTMETPAEPRLKRAVLKYFGGKWRMASWIISHFPPHKVYVEPFGGGAGVLMNKQPASAEIYNDLNYDAVNYFKVLRDPDMASQLAATLALTPYARYEYDHSEDPTNDPVEKARRYCCSIQMALGCPGRPSKAGFNNRLSGWYLPVEGWNNYTQHISSFTSRLKEVSIECRPALKVIETYDTDETLFYCDPPYVHKARSSNRTYKYEMSDQDHIDLAERLHNLKGMAVISGYQSDLYSELYADWPSFTHSARTEMNFQRTECIWLSPRTDEALKAACASSLPLLERL